MTEKSEEKVREFVQKLKDLHYGSYLAQLTDRLEADNFTDDVNGIEQLDMEKVLDIRAFNEKKEIHLYRGDIGKEFYLRVKNDETEVPQNSYDETQFLEKDKKRFGDRSEFIKWNGDAIRIRNYINFYANGQAYVEDWRIAGIVKKGEEVKNGTV